MILVLAAVERNIRSAMVVRRELGLLFEISLGFPFLAFSVLNKFSGTWRLVCSAIAWLANNPYKISRY